MLHKRKRLIHTRGYTLNITVWKWWSGFTPDEISSKARKQIYSVNINEHGGGGPFWSYICLSGKTCSRPHCQISNSKWVPCSQWGKWHQEDNSEQMQLADGFHSQNLVEGQEKTVPPVLEWRLVYISFWLKL